MSKETYYSVKRDLLHVINVGRALLRPFLLSVLQDSLRVEIVEKKKWTACRNGWTSQGGAEYIKSRVANVWLMCC